MKAYFVYIMSALCLTSCQLGIPSESDIRQKIAGQYCADGVHFMEISDSAYDCKYRLNDTITQQCSGTFALHQDEDRWEIHFMPDANADLMYKTNCEKIYTLWTAKEGYLIGRDTVKMRDLFTNKPLERCNN